MADSNSINVRTYSVREGMKMNYRFHAIVSGAVLPTGTYETRAAALAAGKQAVREALGPSKEE